MDRDREARRYSTSDRDRDRSRRRDRSRERDRDRSRDRHRDRSRERRRDHSSKERRHDRSSDRSRSRDHRQRDLSRDQRGGAGAESFHGRSLEDHRGGSNYYSQDGGQYLEPTPQYYSGGQYPEPSQYYSGSPYPGADQHYYRGDQFRGAEQYYQGDQYYGGGEGRGSGHHLEARQHYGRGYHVGAGHQYRGGHHQARAENSYLSGNGGGSSQVPPRTEEVQWENDSPSPPEPLRDISPTIPVPDTEETILFERRSVAASENVDAVSLSGDPTVSTEGLEPGEIARGRGRGRGRGGRGGRGARRGMREAQYDLVVTRPQTSEGSGISKRAPIVNGSQACRLQGNFFKVICKPDWCIYHYRVDFVPDEQDTRIKKKLLRVHGNDLGAYIFDGSSLYVSHHLKPDPKTFVSTRESDQESIEITIRLVADLAPTDVMYLQFFNIIVRKCLESMDLEEMGRHYYDRHQAIRIEAHHLELWPGFKTSMRNHEHDILLGVEITHKVLRIDNCLQVINNMLCRNDQKRIRDDLVGNIVMTRYNRKTYRIDDMDWETTPLSTFDVRGKQKTFIEYFKEKYDLDIRDPRQPMLVSRPKKRDFHRGMTGPILLIPELCQMTGLTDEMRANNNLMRALATHLHTDPARRIDRLKDFMRRLRSKQPIQEELERWGLSFQDRLVEFDGHVIPKENILFGAGQYEVPNDKYDWGQAFRNKPLLSSIPLKTWVVIVPSRDAHAVDRLVGTMQRVARPLQFFIANPAEIRRVTDIRPNDYAKAVDMVMNEYRDRIQMVFVILPRQVTDIYAAVKKRACLEFGVPSQCFVAKNAHNERGIMSICTKIVVQMSAKLGGEPWTVQIPLKNLMIVGFDVYHCGKRKGASVGAMVATTSSTHAKYFSTVSHHTSRDDLSEKVGTDFTKCLNAYQKINQCLPDRIIMFRDGVGDGQLKYVYETELKKIEECMKGVYAAAGRNPPKLSFIVVTKRINTRIFADDRGRPVNPGPGTVADDVITLPERYDFYLISQHSRQGTVSPVAYNVLYDRQGLDADKMQRLTFKLCHLYFNWSGTVTVPAPCQYAHKLAYLTGLALGGQSHERLSNLLYYL